MNVLYYYQNELREGGKKVSAGDPIFGGSCVRSSYPFRTVTSLGFHKQPERQKEQKLGVSKEAQSIKTAKMGYIVQKLSWRNVGENRFKSTKMSKIGEKLGNPMPF